MTPIIETLITECAQRPNDGPRDQTFFVLKGTELFANCRQSLPSPGKQPQLQLATASAGGMERVLMLFTSKTNTKLDKPFAGLGWDQAVKIAQSDPSVEGIMVINLADDWIIFDRQSLYPRVN